MVGVVSVPREIAHASSGMRPDDSGVQLGSLGLLACNRTGRQSRQMTSHRSVSSMPPVNYPDASSAHACSSPPSLPTVAARGLEQACALAVS